MERAKPSEHVKEIELPEALIRLRHDGIVHVHYKKNTTLDVELQERMRDIYAELTKKKANFIFSADEGFVITREARENAKTVQRSSVIDFYAIIVSNLSHRLIANFYFRVTRPGAHYKLFTDIEEAVRWLNSRKLKRAREK